MWCSLLGHAHGKPNLCIVFEFMAGGSIYDHLRKVYFCCPLAIPNLEALGQTVWGVQLLKSPDVAVGRCPACSRNALPLRCWPFACCQILLPALDARAEHVIGGWERHALHALSWKM